MENWRLKSLGKSRKNNINEILTNKLSAVVFGSENKRTQLFSRIFSLAKQKQESCNSKAW